MEGGEWQIEKGFAKSGLGGFRRAIKNFSEKEVWQ
jgi:hypothetical protein